jgi:L-lactate utilization protein LutC
MKRLHSERRKRRWKQTPLKRQQDERRKQSIINVLIQRGWLHLLPILTKRLNGDSERKRAFNYRLKKKIENMEANPDETEKKLMRKAGAEIYSHAKTKRLASFVADPAKQTAWKLKMRKANARSRLKRKIEAQNIKEEKVCWKEIMQMISRKKMRNPIRCLLDILIRR